MPHVRDMPGIEIGKPITHADLGEGVVIGIESTGFVRVYFRTHGERQVPLESIQHAQTWEQQVVASLKPATPEALENLWLAIEAEELPLMESAAVLTSAKVDLLPHQVVLVHRIAQARPRRFLIADEVGLGKTIEIALILRELASRGELCRAIVIVPAGLVDNWRRELNDVFNLDFEVFGIEGDVSDRRSNAFAKHNRLIVSVDTLKRPARMKRLVEAPAWDLAVFDEAHHLSVYKDGRKSRKTQNYKLAEAIRSHCRDLLLLSATPHQGDHFRFWMLIQLLDPSLFEDEYNMVDNRHRLNAVVIRRTKADACNSTGEPLFARRQVHTEAFSLSEPEKVFYNALLDYLRDGYALAESQNGKNRALGFIMTIFQKIASSSFAAVRSTLRRRLLMLTLQEAIERDEALDVTGRDRTIDEAREQIHALHGLQQDSIGRAQVDRILADLKVQLLQKRRDSIGYLDSAEALDDSEYAAATADEATATTVLVALPEERRRIRDLLERFPPGTETKTRVLLDALHAFWQINPQEKLVVFTTYLGSIDTLRDAINQEFPGKGVEVLKGGDHGAKIAAQKRFKRSDGPQVLLTTAAGREGINLQFARILFNHDLPWNPMDLEQRIGRIHRYGQLHTAQVYNLVAADTIEGRVFLLLEQKLRDIAKALGKVDERGEVTEDLRAQILGQLGSRLSYERLYQDALKDLTLTRTRQELEVAMSNANLARHVVFELFQDLDTFNLGDYQKYDDGGQGMRRLVSFVSRAAKSIRAEFRARGGPLYTFATPGESPIQFTTDRDQAMQQDTLHLLGLEHPTVRSLLDRFRSFPAHSRALITQLAEESGEPGILATWLVTIHGTAGQTGQRVIKLAFTAAGDRSLMLERRIKALDSLRAPRTVNEFPIFDVEHILQTRAQAALHRELEHATLLPEGASYMAKMLACLIVQ